MTESTLKLTTAQAIIKYLSNQFIEIDGSEMRICGGGFGIFGHGNVTCLGEALYDHREDLPLYRGKMNKVWVLLLQVMQSNGCAVGSCFAPLVQVPAQQIY